MVDRRRLTVPRLADTERNVLLQHQQPEQERRARSALRNDQDVVNGLARGPVVAREGRCKPAQYIDPDHEMFAMNWLRQFDSK